MTPRPRLHPHSSPPRSRGSPRSSSSRRGISAARCSMTDSRTSWASANSGRPTRRSPPPSSPAATKSSRRARGRAPARRHPTVKARVGGWLCLAWPCRRGTPGRCRGCRGTSRPPGRCCCCSRETFPAPNAWRCLAFATAPVGSQRPLPHPRRPASGFIPTLLPRHVISGVLFQGRP